MLKVRLLVNVMFDEGFGAHCMPPKTREAIRLLKKLTGPRGPVTRMHKEYGEAKEVLDFIDAVLNPTVHPRVKAVIKAEMERRFA